MAELSPLAARVVVVGSANVDLSIEVDRLPAPGETVFSRRIRRGGGGKGANQAVSAARLGAAVSLIGVVGDDQEGAWLRHRLEADDVDISQLAVARGDTGLALVMVDDRGENSIVVSSGTNALLELPMLEGEGARPLLADADVVLTQWETPPSVARGLRPLTSGRIVLNPAPATGSVGGLPAPASGRSAIGDVDVVVPNRGELAALVGGEDDADPSVVADQALTLDVPAVVVTLGAAGAMVVSAGSDGPRVVTVPAIPVAVVDTTAAGDAFCGALAVALGEGASLIDAVRWAVRVAGRAVTARGAQDSLPHRADVGDWAAG